MIDHIKVVEKAINYANSRNKYFLGLRVGAVAMGDEQTSFGVNHLVSQSYARPEILNNREERLKYVVHAEADALNNSFYQVKSMHCNYMPCIDCARKIVAAGVQEVYYAENLIPGVVEKWSDSWAEARRLFEAHGLKVTAVRIPYDKWEDEDGTWSDDGGMVYDKQAVNNY